MVGAGETLRQALERDAHAERRETALGLLMGAWLRNDGVGYATSSKSGNFQLRSRYGSSGP